MTVDPMDGEGSQENPMIVDECPMGPNEDAAAKARDVEEGPKDAVGQARDPEEALVRGEGIAQ